MKYLIRLLCALLFCLLSMSRARGDDTAGQTYDLSIAIDKRIDFSVDKKNHAILLTGTGEAELGSSAVDTDAFILALTFTKPDDPILQKCLKVLESSLPEGMEYGIWGHGHSTMTPQGQKYLVNVTLDTLTGCERQPIPPIVMQTPPPSPLDSIQNPSATTYAFGWPYGGDALDGEDYQFLENALKENGEVGMMEQAFVRTLLPDMAVGLHAIISDGKRTDDQKKAAIRGMMEADLTPQDKAYLDKQGHGGRSLQRLSGINRAQLHFLINDSAQTDAEKREHVDALLKSADQAAKAEGNQGPPSLPVMMGLALVAAAGFIFSLRRVKVPSVWVRWKWRLAAGVVALPVLGIVVLGGLYVQDYSRFVDDIDGQGSPHFFSHHYPDGFSIVGLSAPGTATEFKIPMLLKYRREAGPWGIFMAVPRDDTRFKSIEFSNVTVSYEEGPGDVFEKDQLKPRVSLSNSFDVTIPGVIKRHASVVVRVEGDMILLNGGKAPFYVAYSFRPEHSFSAWPAALRIPG